MIKMAVWREVNKLERNANKRLVGSKWVFKIKRNGVYRARLVAKGFSQIPGEDFTENFSPVINRRRFYRKLLLGLKMVPTLHEGIWYLEAFSDSDFANDKETRISVYGYVIYFCGVPVAWKSKSMRSVVLSRTEAEYVVISEVVKEIKFVYQLLKSMNVKVPLPINVRVDNIGAIWLVNNSGVSERTKHVDTRAHFVRSYVINEVVTIEFVKSNENISDIMMKNQQSSNNHNPQVNLVYTVKEMNGEGHET